MATRLEPAGSTVYLYTTDAPPPAGSRWRSIARARVVDEISGEPVLQTIAVTSERRDLVARNASGGIVGLIARPAHVFPALDVLPVDLDMTVAASGFLPRRLSGTLGPIAGFPTAFAPLDFGEVALHRPGVTLAGRVVSNMTTPQPIAGATVTIDAVWSTLPPAHWSPPALAEPPDLVALRPGLHAARDAGAAIAQRDLALSAQAKVLLLPLAADATRARLSDRDGLGAGGVLVVDRDDPSRVEAIEMAHVETTYATDQPAWVTLAHPARHLHRTGAVCTDGTPQAAVAPTTLSVSGGPGDRVAVLAAAPAWPDGAFVEIDDGIGAREFQRIERYATASDAEGHFRLPPIARVALVRLRAQAAGFIDATPIVTLDYRSAIQPVTLRME